MDKTGLERDEYKAKSLFKNQSPGSHAKRRIVFLNRKMLKKRLYYIQELMLQSFMSVVGIHIIYSGGVNNIHLVERVKRTKSGDEYSEACLLLLLNSCPY